MVDLLNGECISLLCCPICKKQLIQHDNSLKCAQNHSFDIAREGYVNLLVSRKKLSATVGDSNEMLQARSRFLDGGHYHPLAIAIAQEAVNQFANYANQNECIHVVDVGCGEGYYISQVQSICESQLPNQHVCFYGVDIAKTAVRMAARRVKNGRFLVSDVNKELPFPDQSVGLLLNIFAPRNAAEFARILARKGLLLVVIPHKTHLQSLREQFGLLSIEADKTQHLINQLGTTFVLHNSSTISIPLRLTETAVSDLIHMTPNARHLTSTQTAAINALDFVETNASCQLLSFRRQ
jgi:23S rRNA (guanine745-N1)-methyltransferase